MNVDNDLTSSRNKKCDISAENSEMLEYIKKYKVSTKYPELEKGESTESIIYTLSVSFVDDLDIMYIHSIICKDFANKRMKVDDLKRDFNLLMRRSKSHDLTYNQSRSITKKAEEIRKTAERYESNKEWSEYIKQVVPLLKKYSYYMSDTTKKIFRLDDSERIESPEFIKTRIDIIENYLSILNKYINVNITREKNNQARCALCNAKFDEENVDTDQCLYLCKCGYSYYMMSREVSYHDPYQIGMSSLVEEESGIMENINRFRGKKNNLVIPDHPL